ncbi:M50 family metallopeptidase [Elusimicrobiota bacterium]
MTIKCPECGYDNKDDAAYCNLCQEGLEKTKDNAEYNNKKPPTAPAPSQPPARNNILADSWLWCLAALVISFLITPRFRLIWFPFRFVKVFWHEIGHTIPGWLFGYFTIPAVNPVDTAGVAMSLSYSPGFPYFLLAIMAAGTYFLRKYKHMVHAGLSCMAVYGLVAFTPAKDWVITAGGILAEYIMVGACLYLCLFKERFKFKIERLLYGILGWHALVERIKFLIRLKSDSAFYKDYVNGTGWQTGMIGDLAKISFDVNYRFTVDSFNTIVNLFIVLAFVPLILIAVLAVKRLRSS